ncbi:MAG: hypothetical protein EP332_08230 [Bacteroidetes bacterium]|nr:MAG: hypothetical protein EP332_08230 [Bacteroidota bacterium]
MKNIKSRLPILALAAFALILSSCGQQRYSSRAYVKKEVVASAEVKKQDKQEVTQLPAIPASQVQQTGTPQSNAPQTIELRTTAPAQELGSERVQSPVQAPAAETPSNRASEKASKTVVNRLTKIEKAAENGDVSLGNKWVRLIIIGLIILLIGIILPGGIGYVFYLVGSILMLVGLIMLLLELL